MTTFGDNIRTKVAAAFTKLNAVPMTLRTGLFLGHDAGSGRSVGTTPTDYVLTGVLVVVAYKRDEHRQLQKTGVVYLDGGTVDTAGAVPAAGDHVLVGTETWIVADAEEIRPDLTPALWVLDVTA